MGAGLVLLWQEQVNVPLSNYSMGHIDMRMREMMGELIGFSLVLMGIRVWN